MSTDLDVELQALMKGAGRGGGGIAAAKTEAEMEKTQKDPRRKNREIEGGRD